MNVKTQNSLKNNKQNNENFKIRPNYLQHQTYKKTPSIKNKYQSDIKLKTNCSPYYKIHKKLTSDSTNSENQKILLKKRELEIKDLKIKCQKLEQENYNYQIQNKILKNTFNKNNNIININDCFIPNNTSSNFPIRNEIKKLWENFAKIELLNNFIDFENEPEIIYHLICELILLSDKMIKEHCLLKYQEIIKIMGMKNNSGIIKDLETQFKNFMKEHLNEIFNYLKDNSFINEFKRQYKDIINKNIVCIYESENNMKKVEDILEQYEFNDMLKNINDIILFTQFNEPTLYFKIENIYENRKIKFIKINNENKKEYIIVNEQGNSNINNKAIVLLEPPCMKSGYFFYKELKPILMSIGPEIKEVSKNDIDFEDLKISNKNNELLSNEKNNYDNNYNKEFNENKFKFNSINNTSRINRNLKLEIFSNNRKNQIDYINLYTNDSSDNNYLINNYNSNINYEITSIDKDSFLDDKIKIKNIIFVNSTKPPDKRSPQFNNLSISKDVNSDNNDLFSTEENNYIENNQINNKKTINIKNKRYNKIHRINSANNYFDKNYKKINREKSKNMKQKTDLIKKEKINRIYNNYKRYINNNLCISKKDIILSNFKGSQSLSNDKYFQKPLTSKKHINIKNKKVDNNNYNCLSNNKINKINYNNKKESNLNINYIQKSANERLLKNCKTKPNLKSNNTLYKNSFSILNRMRNKDIISPPSNVKKAFKNKEKSKENLVNEIEHNNKNNIIKNIINHKNKKKKSQNIKINYKNYNYNSNRNILNNNSINPNYSNLSRDRKKSNSKRIDSFDQKNSFIYTTFEEIRKIMYDTHRPVIMISTNSNINHNTININNRHSKIKSLNFNKKNANKSLGRKNNYNNYIYNYNTINESINQIISFPQQKNNENESINYNSFGYSDKNKYNKKTNSFIQNSNNNRGIYCKQFSMDETTFNTSNQFNLTHDYNSKSNIKNKNYNNCIKIPKNKDSALLSKEIINIKSKLSHNNNLNYNKHKVIEINIDDLNTNQYINFDNIETLNNKKRYYN